MSDLATGTSRHETAAPRAPGEYAPFLQVGAWQVGKLLGRGRWARVYEARPADRPASEPADYAIKLPDADARPAETAIAHLARETQAGRCVTHPHLACVLSAHVHAAPHFVVLPFLPGGTLAEVLKRRGSIALGTALWIARQTAEALEALHKAGWIHGDVKPANIVIAPSGHATLIDLGCARRTGTSGLPDEQMLAGTLPYLAAESFTSSAWSRPPSDVYSLGATLYEMLAGGPPYRCASAAEYAAAHLREQPPDLRTRLPHLPSPVARLVSRMLAKEPLRRPTTSDLVAQLAWMEIEDFAERLQV
jgi:serine/threonine protein kinase